MTELVAAERGFSFAEPYAIGALFCGVAVLAAIGALSHQHERAFSASLIYLGLGVASAVVIQLLGVGWLDPISDAELLQRVSEAAIVIALFATGLKLDRPLTWRSWSGVGRLLIIAMPLTIAAVALFGSGVMGLSLGAALVLGAILAPTDPVLAGDVGVGPPGDEDEREPNFSLTGEAGLNDGLAFPFLFLGLFVAKEGGSSWLGTWLVADVLYAVVVGIAIGIAGGYLLGAAAVELRKRDLLAEQLDPWMAIPAVLLVYGAAEISGAYGFLAAFAGGVGFRHYEHGHAYNRRVHDGAETVEKFGELAVILLIGSMIGTSVLTAPDLEGWLLVAVLLLVIRPLAVAASLVGSGLPAAERAFVAWFGVRGVGSLYYAAVAVVAGVLPPAETEIIVWTAIACVMASIVVHGLSATPVSRRMGAAQERAIRQQESSARTPDGDQGPAVPSPARDTRG
jgi:sodium/hydrogen antiporter